MKALLEILKALYNIRDAIINKKNNGGEEQNNGGEGSGDIKLIKGTYDFFFYDSKEIIVPELPLRSSSANSIALSEIYNEEDINTIKDIFKRTLDCLEYNEVFRKFLEDHPVPDEVAIDISSMIPASSVFISNPLSEQIEEASSSTNYTIHITNDSFTFGLNTKFINSESTAGLTIYFDDYLFYDKTTGKYIWEMEGFDVDTLITGNTLVDYTIHSDVQ